jgi:hypothetical protein
MRLPACERQYKQWTEDERTYLIEHWGRDMRRTAIAAHLRRSVSACHAMAEMLGLRLNGEDWRLVELEEEGAA